MICKWADNYSWVIANYIVFLYDKESEDNEDRMKREIE
jgi:hypothetical protein